MPGDGNRRSTDVLQEKKICMDTGTIIQLSFLRGFRLTHLF
ncbi:hypothetical protein Mpsy_1759 [Methanolobus psychrophilus R15]|nr:hypothetical protein Mpsy_1759 [Methanolobus psychrophilus R15]